MGSSYITDNKGYVTAIKIKKTKFNDTTLLSGFKRVMAIDLFENNITSIDISNLPELRHFTLFKKGDQKKKLVRLKNLNKLAYLKMYDLDTSNFEKISGLESLYKAEFTSITLQSFAGLENMPNLKELEISIEGKHAPEKFTSIAGIPKNHKLEWLKLSTAYATDLTPLANFTSLKYLELWATHKTLTDYTPLNKLKQLEQFEITARGVSDFSFLQDMPKLKQIISYHSPFLTLNGLNGAPNLETLELNKGKLKRISHLEQNTNLKTLSINGHALSKIEGLESLKKLKKLDVSSNKIKKIEGLDNNLCLETLWLSGNPIKDFENIFHLPLLYEMGIDRTKISEFPNWEKLQRLGSLSVDKSQLNPDLFHKENFWWVNLPIKDFDEKLRYSEKITDKERKQYGCI